MQGEAGSGREDKPKTIISYRKYAGSIRQDKCKTKLSYRKDMVLVHMTMIKCFLFLRNMVTHPYHHAMLVRSVNEEGGKQR
jgi:hypothetical protein